MAAETMGMFRVMLREILVLSDASRGKILE
jgi:hypothetical protein